MKNIIFIFILIFCSTFLFSQTVIPGGNVSGSWSVSGSPYLVEGQITIPDGQTLTIDPGCLIEFQGHYEFNVQGRLLAVGSEIDSILFTSTVPWNLDDNWRGVKFDTTPASNDSSKFVNCILEFTHNYDGLLTCGGAIFSYYFSKILISKCLIRENTNVAYGLYNPESRGAGIYLQNSSPIIENSIISNNAGIGNDTSIGGGIFCMNSSPKITNCIISNNSAACCSGLYFRYSNPLLINTIISGNSHNGITFVHSNAVLTNCLINGNYWSGITSIDSELHITNCSVINNSGYYGAGIVCGESSINLVNTVLWNNYPNQVLFYYYYDPNFLTVFYSDIQGGEAGIITNGNGTVDWLEGNIDSDPLFIDPENGNFHFFSDSPCINTGTPDTTGLNLPEYDLDGNPRIYDDRIDMGCYEWQGTGAENDQLQITNYKLQNYPNPFNPETEIAFSIPNDFKKANIEIYNIKGQKIKTFLISNFKFQISNSINWNGTDENNKPVGSGIYFYQLKVDGQTKASKKMLLMK